MSNRGWEPKVSQSCFVLFHDLQEKMRSQGNASLVNPELRSHQDMKSCRSMNTMLIGRVDVYLSANINISAVDDIYLWYLLSSLHVSAIVLSYSSCTFDKSDNLIHPVSLAFPLLAHHLSEPLIMRSAKPCFTIHILLSHAIDCQTGAEWTENAFDHGWVLGSNVLARMCFEGICTTSLQLRYHALF